MIITGKSFVYPRIAALIMNWIGNFQLNLLHFNNKKMLRIIIFCGIISIVSNTAVAQLELTKQSQVDSFVNVMDTGIIYNIYFRYDINIPDSDTIKNLSGFNQVRFGNYSFVNFKWTDIPWFSKLEDGSLNIINMQKIKTISGMNSNRFEGELMFDNSANLEAYPPKNLLKQCNGLILIDIERDSILIDLTGIEQRVPMNNWANKIELYDNRIKYLKIIDPNGAGYSLVIDGDSVLETIEHVGGYDAISIDWENNKKLTNIRGFRSIKLAGIRSLRDNSSLSDVCVLRDAIDSAYQRLGPRLQPMFNDDLSGNAIGANSYEEIMAYDCSWMNDTATVSEWEEQKIAKGLSIYPNPSRGRFNFLAPADKQIQKVSVYTLQGVEVPVEFEAGQRNVVEMEEAAQGMYVLKVEYADGETAAQGIIKKE